MGSIGPSTTFAVASSLCISPLLTCLKASGGRCSSCWIPSSILSGPSDLLAVVSSTSTSFPSRSACASSSRRTSHKPSTSKTRETEMASRHCLSSASTLGCPEPPNFFSACERIISRSMGRMAVAGSVVMMAALGFLAEPEWSRSNTRARAMVWRLSYEMVIISCTVRQSR